MPLERFTPTGVGTMTPVGAKPASVAVHPHGRGDNFPPPPKLSQNNGSPPRAWGQCLDQRQARRLARFTPTGVGTMDGTNWTAVSNAVHPHGRGDNGG